MRIRTVRPSLLHAVVAAAASVTLASQVLAQSAWTLTAIPDTQFYTQTQANFDQGAFQGQVDWIVNNRASHNIRFVSHLGDITQNATVAEFDRAVQAMAPLHNLGDLPYSVVPGNHDYSPTGKNTNLTNFTAAFGASRYAGRSWFGGGSANGGNFYQTFSAGGRTFLHIGIEYQPDNVQGGFNSVPWAQAIIDANPSLPTIISTHDYIIDDPTVANGRSASGEHIFQNLVRRNDQVFMTLNGHYHRGTNGDDGERFETATNDRGRPVFQLLTDYQAYPNSGDGWFRHYVFDEAANKIHTVTHSIRPNAVNTAGSGASRFHVASPSNPYAFPAGLPAATTGTFQVDANSRFSIDMNFADRLTVLPPLPPPPPPPPPAPVSLSAAGYSENFNSIGTTGTTPPTGWRHFNVSSGSNNTWTNATGITGSVLAGQAINTTPTTLVVTTTPSGTNNAGWNAARSASTPNDRALATSPTTNAGTAFQLSLTNDTGTTLTGFDVSYDIIRYTAASSANDLPGYQLFYSFDSGSSWVNAFNLNPTLSTAGTVQVPNSAGITTVPLTTVFFHRGARLPVGGNLLLRWVDDNATQTSPDQILGLDNVQIRGRSNPAPLRQLNLGGFTEDFNTLGTTGTLAPTGFSVHSIAGSDSTYGASGLPNSIVGSGDLRGPLTPASNPTASNSSGYNAATSAAPTDRALATAPTGVGASVIELLLSNDTPFALTGVQVGYDVRQFNTNGVEEAPGYRLFYSLDAGATWLNVQAFDRGTAGTAGAVGVTSIAPTSILFPTDLDSNARLLLRFVDDNAVAGDPVIGIDNLVISPITDASAVLTRVASGTADLVVPAFALASLDLGGRGFGSRTLSVADTGRIDTLLVAIDLAGTPEAIAAAVAGIDTALPVPGVFGPGFDFALALPVDGGGLVRFDFGFLGTGVSVNSFTAVVPEPAVLGLLTPAALLLGRRRR